MSKPKRSNVEVQQELDLRHLLAQPGFRRFLLRIYFDSGMAQSAYGSEDRHLLQLEGRRSLGFDIFRWCDDASSLPERTALKMALAAEDAQPPGDSDDHDQDQ